MTRSTRLRTITIAAAILVAFTSVASFAAMNASASNALDQVRAFFGIAEPEPAISTTNSSPTAEPAEPTFFAGESPFDSFSDGDFTSSPVWGGNTANWTIVANSDAAAGATSSNTLRLAGPATATTEYLSSQISSWGTSQEWGVWIGRRAQAFTAANQQYVWLYANESTLNNTTVDGYRIAIGDDSGGDNIRLEYIVNGALSATVINSSGTVANGLTDVGFLVRVTRSSTGAWQIFTSALPTANGAGAIATDTPNFESATISQGSATHNTLVPASNGYLGVAALHSTAPDAVATAEFDQFYFTSPIPTPTLGNYPTTPIALSGNTTVTPDAAPSNTTSINVSAPTGFKGILSADTATGVVRITNAALAKIPAGAYPITVTAFGSGGSTTKTFNLTVSPTSCVGTSSFGSVVSNTVGTTPQSVAVGDFNGDGKQDLIVANSGSDSVTRYTGTGAGTFSASVNYSVGTWPMVVAVGDFNNDGKDDAVTANYTTNNVSVLIGSGSGAFAAAVNYAVGTAPYAVGVGDFNGDGKLDIAAANGNSANISVLLGTGTGTFGAATNFTTGTTPNSITVGDFNGDGKQDLIVANSGSDSVTRYTGTGAGTFSASVNYSVGTWPMVVAVGDFNNDGKDDAVTANYTTNNVSVLIGSGSGAFAAAVNYAVGTAPYAVGVGDFNGDGKLDIAAANGNSANISVLLGTGTGTFGAATNFTTGTTPNSITVGDFNGDGKQDIAVANRGSNTVSIFIGNGAGSFAAKVDFTVGSSPYTTSLGDFNGDGKQDIVTANGGTTTVSVLIGNGAGSFAAATNFSVGGGPYFVTVGDVNGDGKQDLATANFSTNNVSVLTGDGAGNFGGLTNYTVGTNPGSITLGDFNADGYQDFAVTNSTSANMSVRLGTCVLPNSTVTFNANGGTGTMANQTTNTPTALTTNAFTRTGYTFSGWNTAANGSGTAYANGATYPFTANVTLYAQWTINQYTLTYNGNGNTGGTAPSPVTQDYNTTVAAAAPGTLVRSGYTFTGWNTASNGSGNTYAVGAPFTFTASTTLYAQWIAAPTITLDTAALAFGNGNTGFGSAPQSKAISGANLTGDITCTAPADFQVSSNGTSWGSTAIFTQSGGSASGTLRTRFNPGSTGVKSGSVSCTSNFAATQSFTAGGTGFNPQYRGGRIDWQKSGIANITFTAEAAFRTSDFGTVAINDLIDVGADLDYGDGTALEDVRLKVTSVNAGEGWFYGTLVKVGGAALTYTYPTANATYKAVWKGTGRLAAANNFSTSDWRSAADVKIETTVTTTRSSRSTVTPVLYVQDNSIVSFMLPITSFDGYTTTAAIGTAGDFVANPAVPSAQVVPPGLTVGANGLVSWDVRDSVQAGVASGQIYYLAVTLDNGHWTVSPVEVMVSVTPAAVLNLDLTALDFGSVTVGADSPGQTKAVSGSNLPADILCQSTPDYQVSSNGTVWNNFATFTQSGGNASGTLYTRFSPTSGGSIPGQVQCSSGTAAVKTFETGGIGVAPSYTVTFNSNGGSGTMAPQTANTPTPLNANAFMRTGYTFAGWGTSPGGPAILGNGVTYSFAANITLYAQWTINQYTLTYNGNGNTGGTAPGSVTQNYNTSVSVAGAGTLTRSGYTFGGWNTADDGSGTGYAPSSTFTFPGANTTLFAVWNPITYQLTVNAGAGGAINEPGTSPATVDHGSPTTIIAVANVGYTFTNWTVTAGSASIANPSSAVTTVTLTAGNATVQANFTPLTTVQLGAAGSFIGVEGSTAAVTVTRTGVTTGTSTVQYALSGGTATVGTCGVGSADYVAGSGTLTFGPSETTKTVNVTLCGDAITESPDETIGVTISSPTGAVLGTPDDGSVRIIDTDADYLNTSEFDTTAGGTATTYPVPITVSGFTGNISGLTVSLFAVTQNVPDDIDILLVSPDGTRKMVIMSYAGGSQPLSNVSFRFADTAAGFVPDPGPITEGAVYKPTNCVASVSDFPAPAPAGPYSEPGCSGSPTATFASVFGGMDPNGVWKLYVRDHSTPLAPLAGNGHHYGWGIHFVPLVPTAGEVAVAGRVVTADGTGIRNARITVSGGDLAQPLTALTGAFGNYRVEGLTAGETYVVTVASKSYVFEAPSRVVTLGDSVAGLDFTARP